ncbi:MAG TPA: phage holin family protein [Candidatus Koribacter sp.]|jgi:VIT1/CCC1 family predicted Fe2+/Mn2+ transporter
MINDVQTENGKNIADVLHDFKNEFSTFVVTRVQMLQEEMKIKATAIKAALPMLIAGIAFLAMAWLLFTAAVVCAIAVAMPNNPWSYAISFAIVMAFYAILGALLAIMGKNALSKQGLKPEKTIRVLEEDKIWLQTEATRIQA